MKKKKFDEHWNNWVGFLQSLEFLKKSWISKAIRPDLEMSRKIVKSLEKWFKVWTFLFKAATKCLMSEVFPVNKSYSIRYVAKTFLYDRIGLLVYVRRA